MNKGKVKISACRNNPVSQKTSSSNVLSSSYASTGPVFGGVAVERLRGGEKTTLSRERSSKPAPSTKLRQTLPVFAPPKAGGREGKRKISKTGRRTTEPAHVSLRSGRTLDKRKKRIKKTGVRTGRASSEQ